MVLRHFGTNSTGTFKASHSCNKNFGITQPERLVIFPGGTGCPMLGFGDAVMCCMHVNQRSLRGIEAEEDECAAWVATGGAMKKPLLSTHRSAGNVCKVL
jgi:hypothetical protein